LEEVRPERARRLAAATPTPLLVPVFSSSSALEVVFRRSDGREHKGGDGCWMLVCEAREQNTWRVVGTMVGWRRC
jgi:hypothetical protein